MDYRFTLEGEPLNGMACFGSDEVGSCQFGSDHRVSSPEQGDSHSLEFLPKYARTIERHK